jgi:hypothetical protein
MHDRPSDSIQGCSIVCTFSLLTEHGYDPACLRSGNMCEGTEKIVNVHKPRLNGHKVENSEPDLSWFAALTTYFGYAVLIFIGHLRDFCGRWDGARVCMCV